MSFFGNLLGPIMKMGLRTFDFGQFRSQTAAVESGLTIIGKLGFRHYMVALVVDQPRGSFYLP